MSWLIFLTLGPMTGDGYGSPIARLLLGNQSGFSPEGVRVGLTALVVRTGLLFIAGALVRERWRWVYWAALSALGADVIAAVALVILNGVGPAAAVVGALLDTAAMWMTASCAEDFGALKERIPVQPEKGGAGGASAYYKKGYHYSRRDMWAMAVAQWRQAVGLAPETGSYYKALAVGYIRIGRPDRALPALRQAIHLLPDDPDLPYMLEQLEQHLGRQDVELDTMVRDRLG